MNVNVHHEFEADCPLCQQTQARIELMAALLREQYGDPDTLEDERGHA